MSLFDAVLTKIILPIVGILIILAIVRVVLTIVLAANFLNKDNKLISTVLAVSKVATEPFAIPLRSFLPKDMKYDFSPVLLIFILIFIRDWAIPALVRGKFSLF